MVEDFTILEQLELFSLPHVKLFLSENVLKTLVICMDLTPYPVELMSLDL